MLLDDLLQEVPDLRLLQLDHLLGRLDRRDQPLLLELVVDERLEQLERHLLRQPALVELQLGPDDDDRAARIVDALPQEVLAEPALLPLERVGERLQRPVVGAAQDAAAAPVVEQGVDGLLKHPFFVSDDDFRGAQLEELLQPVVAVDDAPVQIVQVGRREAAAVERHEGPQLRRDDRNHVEDHPLRLVPRLAEGVDDLEPLGELQALLGRGLGLHPGAHFERELLDAHPPQELLDRLGAHLGDELVAVLLAQLPVALFREELLLLEGGVGGIDDDVRLEVQDALQVAERDVEQVADAARQSLEKPDVAHRGRELDMPHALASHLALGHFDTALVADHPPVLHPLELAAQTLPVGDGAEYLGAEQTVALGLEGAVVDRLGLRHFAVRPGADLLRRGQGDADRLEIVDRAGLVREGGALAHGAEPFGVGSHRASPPAIAGSFCVPARSSMSRHKLCSSRTRTLKDSGSPGSTVVSPFTRAS